MPLTPIDRSLLPPTPPDAATGAAVPLSAQPSEPPGPGVTQPRRDARDYIGAPEGGRGPDSPSSATETPNRDWTTVRTQSTAKAPEEPPPEPIYKMLIEQIQSIWRASAQTVDIAEEAQRQANRLAATDGAGRQGPLVYTDPAKVRRPPAA